MEKTISAKICLRHDTKENFDSLFQAQVLADGEVAVASVSSDAVIGTELSGICCKELRIGDGQTQWQDLKPFADPTLVSAFVSLSSTIGTVNDVLDMVNGEVA